MVFDLNEDFLMVQFKGSVFRAGAGGLSEMFGFDTFGLIWKVCSETLLCITPFPISFQSLLFKTKRYWRLFRA